MRNVEKTNVPNPCPDQVERYLRAWDELENYYLQENARINSFLNSALRILKCLTFF